MSNTCAYPMDRDWVFARPTMKGAQPYWPDNLMKRYIGPVARETGIHKRIGWHTFRRNLATNLRKLGVEVKVD